MNAAYSSFAIFRSVCWGEFVAGIVLLAISFPGGR